MQPRALETRSLANDSLNPLDSKNEAGIEFHCLYNELYELGRQAAAAL
jgi:hypothetical protein